MAQPKKILAGLAGLSLIFLASGCADTARQHIASPPLAPSPAPETVFGEATLTPGAKPTDTLVIPAAPNRALTLDDCMALAAKVSPSIDSAEQSQMGAMWTRWQAITNFLPTASTSYGFTDYNDRQAAQGNTHGDTKQYAWQAQISQPLFTGGRNSATYLLSQLGVDAATIQRTQAKEDLMLAVKQAYYSILATEKALDVARTSVVNLESHLDVAQNFFDVGMVPKNQVLEAEVELAKARQQETDYQRDLTVAKTRLNILLRQPLERDVRVVDTLNHAPFPLGLPKCLEISLADSPEMKLGRNQVEVTAKNVDVARSGYYPQVSATYTNRSVGDSPRAHGGWSADDSSWNVGAMANWNFWEWGRTRADVEKSKVELNRAINSLTSLEDSTKLEVTSNYQTLLSAGKNIDVSAQAVESAAEDLRMVRERYLEQVATNTEVLDAQTRYSNAQYDHYQALYNYNLAWATLERSLGRQVPHGMNN